MSEDLDDVCQGIRTLLVSTKQGLRYNDIVEKMQEKGSRATINKHLRHLEEKEYVTCKLVRTGKGRSTVYHWNPTPSKIISYKPAYVFLLVRIGLEIPETPDAKIHHSMIYRFRNQSDDVQEYFGMHIFGDVPKSWKELDPHIYEEEDGASVELGPSNVSVADDAIRKSISIKFTSPLYTGKEKIIRLEYDWEEPNKFWEYRKGENPPDLFEFELIYPAKNSYKLHVYEIDPLTQAKRLAKNEPYQGDRDGKKLIRWQIEDPQIGQVFRFEWGE